MLERQMNSRSQPPAGAHRLPLGLNEAGAEDRSPRVLISTSKQKAQPRQVGFPASPNVTFSPRRVPDNLSHQVDSNHSKFPALHCKGHLVNYLRTHSQFLPCLPSTQEFEKSEAINFSTSFAARGGHVIQSFPVRQKSLAL